MVVSCDCSSSKSSTGFSVSKETSDSIRVGEVVIVVVVG